MFFSLELGAREADEKISYEKYSKVLKTYVDQKGMVNYRKLKENKKEMKVFLDVLRKLEPEDFQTWSDEEKIACGSMPTMFLPWRRSWAIIRLRNLLFELENIRETVFARFPEFGIR